MSKVQLKVQLALWKKVMNYKDWEVTWLEVHAKVMRQNENFDKVWEEGTAEPWGMRFGGYPPVEETGVESEEEEGFDFQECI